MAFDAARSSAPYTQADTGGGVSSSRESSTRVTNKCQHCVSANITAVVLLRESHRASFDRCRGNGRSTGPLASLSPLARCDASGSSPLVRDDNATTTTLTATTRKHRRDERLGRTARRDPGRRGPRPPNAWAPVAAGVWTAAETSDLVWPGHELGAATTLATAATSDARPVGGCRLAPPLPLPPSRRRGGGETPAGRRARPPAVRSRPRPGAARGCPAVARPPAGATSPSAERGQG